MEESMGQEKHTPECQKYDALKLENLICFPLYACARELIKLYKPFLDRIDLTYTQFITMIVLWEKESLTSTELGQALFLDSGTLTPLLKKLEVKGYLTRKRSAEDERNLIVSITNAGQELRRPAREIYHEMVRQFKLDSEDAQELYRLLYKMLRSEKQIPEDFLSAITLQYIAEETNEKD